MVRRAAKAQFGRAYLGRLHFDRIHLDRLHVDAIHFDRDTLDRLNSAMLLGLIGGGLIACAIGALIFDFGRLFGAW